MLRIGYDAAAMRATFSGVGTAAGSDWFSLLRRTLEDHTNDILVTNAESFSVPWWSFLTARPQVLQIIHAYQIRYEIEAGARIQLVGAKSRQAAFQDARQEQPLQEHAVLAKLQQVGFIRT